MGIHYNNKIILNRVFKDLCKNNNHLTKILIHNNNLNYQIISITTIIS
jgi:hypothetical protein